MERVFDRYSGRQSLHWHELAPIIRRAAHPWAAIKFNYYYRYFRDMVTIVDYHLPEWALAKGVWQPHKGELTADGWATAWEAHSLVTNVAWLEGECPLSDLASTFETDEFGKMTTKVRQRPHYGARHALKALLACGTILPTVDVGHLLADEGVLREGYRREQRDWRFE